MLAIEFKLPGDTLYHKLAVVKERPAILIPTRAKYHHISNDDLAFYLNLIVKKGLDYNVVNQNMLDKLLYILEKEGY